MLDDNAKRALSGLLNELLDELKLEGMILFAFAKGEEGTAIFAFDPIHKPSVYVAHLMHSAADQYAKGELFPRTDPPNAPDS